MRSLRLEIAKKTGFLISRLGKWKNWQRSTTRMPPCSGKGPDPRRGWSRLRQLLLCLQLLRLLLTKMIPSPKRSQRPSAHLGRKTLSSRPLPRTSPSVARRLPTRMRHASCRMALRSVHKFKAFVFNTWNRCRAWRMMRWRTTSPIPLRRTLSTSSSIPTRPGQHVVSKHTWWTRTRRLRSPTLDVLALRQAGTKAWCFPMSLALCWFLGWAFGYSGKVTHTFIHFLTHLFFYFLEKTQFLEMKSRQLVVAALHFDPGCLAGILDDRWPWAHRAELERPYGWAPAKDHVFQV